mmetsp:Transcript_18739/g.27758  ORF Transcript_18739/g.27758 Transcript_18739/m.27758 type:complete len:163 (-) Transcript_18739:62-550(-)
MKIADILFLPQHLVILLAVCKWRTTLALECNAYFSCSFTESSTCTQDATVETCEEPLLTGSYTTLCMTHEFITEDGTKYAGGRCTSTTAGNGCDGFRDSLDRDDDVLSCYVCSTDRCNHVIEYEPSDSGGESAGVSSIRNIIFRSAAVWLPLLSSLVLAVKS